MLTVPKSDLSAFTALAVAALLVPDAAPAQEGRGVDVELGERVRVTAPAVGLESHEGTLQGRWTDSLLIRPSAAGSESLHLSPSAIDRLEVHRRVGNHLGTGALVGLGAGVAAGTLGALAICGSAPAGCEEPAGPALPGVFIGVPVAALGVLAGLSAGKHAWIPVDPETVTAGLAPGAPGPGGAGMHAAVRITLP